MNSIFRIAGLAACILIACRPGGPERTLENGLYHNRSAGLTVAFPGAWEIKTDQMFGSIKADIQAFGPIINQFRPNVNVIILPHSGPAKMPEILSFYKAQLQAHFLDLAAYHDSIYAISGKEVGELQYESVSFGKLLHFRQILFMKDGKDVTCTFTDRAEDFPVNADFKSVAGSIALD